MAHRCLDFSLAVEASWTLGSRKYITSGPHVRRVSMRFWSLFSMIICIMIVVVVYIQEGTVTKQSHPPCNDRSHMDLCPQPAMRDAYLRFKVVEEDSEGVHGLLSTPPPPYYCCRGSSPVPTTSGIWRAITCRRLLGIISAAIASTNRTCCSKFSSSGRATA